MLKDEKKRAAYDQFGAASQQPGFDPNAFGQNPFAGFGAGGFPGAGGFSSRGGSPPEDLFDQLFGGAFGSSGGRRGQARRENVRGDDIEASINITFQEAAKGTTKMVNIAQVVNCPPCSGTGLKSGAKRTSCTACNGTGTRTFVIDSGFQMATTCNSCGGSGTTVPRGSQCDGCSGVGKVQQRANIEVPIPAGA
jgi:molecular chaperone DnaJ